VEGGQLGGEGLVLGLAEGVVVEAWREVLRGHGYPRAWAGRPVQDPRKEAARRTANSNQG
jgi:hypothetical protein